MGQSISTIPGTAKTECKTSWMRYKRAVKIERREGVCEHAFFVSQAIIFQALFCEAFVLIIINGMPPNSGRLFILKLEKYSRSNLQFKYTLYNLQMDPQATSHLDKPIRIDLIPNKRMFFILFKIILFFFICTYASRLLPEATQIQSYSPDKWNREDSLDVRKVNPLNRKIRFYVMAENKSESMDPILEAQVYSLRDENEKEMRMHVKIHDLRDFQIIKENQLMYYLGDIHVLDEVAYRLHIKKPEKVAARRLQEQTEEPMQKSGEQEKQTSLADPIRQSDEQRNSDANNLKQQQAEEKQEIRDQVESNYTDSSKEEEERSMQQLKINNTSSNQTTGNNSETEQEKIAREKEEELQRKRLQEEEEERKKEIEKQKERQRLFDKTNIKLQAQLMSNFSTILELVIRYISILIIIYMAADNPRTPRGIGAILVLFSNPLLFMQVSFPNDVSNVIDTFCGSGPLLYPTLWMYYIHHKLKYDDEKDSSMMLATKLTPCIILYFLEVLRLMHFDVLVWETIIGLIVCSMLLWYLWEAFLNIKHQQHRDKMLVSVTVAFLGSLFLFTRLAHSWSFLMAYIIIQTYGLFLLHLMGNKKEKKAKKVIEKDIHEQEVLSTENKIFQHNLSEVNHPIQ